MIHRYASAALMLAAPSYALFQTPFDGDPSRSADMTAEHAVAPMRGELFLQPVDPLGAAAFDEAGSAPAAPQVALSPRRDVLHFTQHEDGTWVRGATYKARVSGGGFTYVPFLGSDSPRNFPVRFRLVSASVDGEPLDLTDHGDVTHDVNRFVLDRGAVDVVYDMELDSVEQSFALDLGGRVGEVTLRIEVTTDLAGTRSGAGHRFAGEHGGIDYGAAFVLDARGRRAGVPVQFDGNALSVTVPSEFIESADGPFVVDPVINTFTVDGISGEQSNVDVAYDLTNNVFTYVYEDMFSGTDTDVYRSSVHAETGVLVSDGYIESGDDDWTDPRIANLNRTDTSLIVATRVNPAVEVVGRILNETTGGLSPVIVIGEANGAWNNFGPDVGGNASLGAFTGYLVVWRRALSSTQTLPRARFVLPDGTLLPVIGLDHGTNTNCTAIAVSKSTGDPSVVNRWTVAYAMQDIPLTTTSFRAVQLNAAGSVVAGPNTLQTMGSFAIPSMLDVSDALDLDDLAEPTYLVSIGWGSEDPRRKALIVCRGVQRQITTFLSLLEHVSLDRRPLTVRLGTTRDQFVVVYSETLSGLRSVALSVADLTEDIFLGVSERRTMLQSNFTGAFTPASPAIASRFSGGFTNSRWSGLGWTKEDANGDPDIQGATHAATLGMNPGFQYCYGNPNSTGDRGFIALYGTRSTVTPKTLVASALPLNAIGMFLCGTGMGEIDMPGTSAGRVCLVGGLFGRYINSLQSTGTGGRLVTTVDPQSIPTSGGFVSAVSGQIWNFQAWHRDVGSSGTTTNYTNGVTILFL